MPVLKRLRDRRKTQELAKLIASLDALAGDARPKPRPLLRVSVR